MRSPELDEVDGGKRAAWELLHLSAGLEVAEIDWGESQLSDQLRDGGLRILVHAGHEHHPLPARLPRIAGKDRCGQRVERLHNASAGQMLGDDFTRGPAAKIQWCEASGTDRCRVHRVDHNAAVPRWKVGHDFGMSRP